MPRIGIEDSFPHDAEKGSQGDKDVKTVETASAGQSEGVDGVGWSWNSVLCQTAKGAAVATAAMAGYFGLRWWLGSGWERASSQGSDKALVGSDDASLQTAGLLDGATTLSASASTERASASDVATAASPTTTIAVPLDAPASAHALSRRANNPPTVVNPIPDQMINVGESYFYPITNSTFQDADGDPLRVSAELFWNASLPNWLSFQFEHIGYYDTPSHAFDVAVSGPLVLVADDAGLQIINITIPSVPTLVGTYNTPGRAIDVAVSGNLVLVADDTSGLQIINITIPSAPTLVGIYDTPGSAQGVAVSGNLVLVADGTSGLKIIDITVPSAPILVATYDTPGYAYGVTASGTLVLVADDTDLQIIDISTPSAPTLVGTYDTPGNAIDVFVSGNLVLVADYNSGLQLIDISTPSAPTLVGTYNTPGKTLGVTVSGNLALVADETSGLQIIDISTPSAPILVTTYDTSYGAYGVAVSGNLVLVAEGWSGLQIINTMQMHLAGIPVLTDVGSYSIKVTVNDRKGGIVSDTFVLVVNSFPTINVPILNQETPIDAPFSLTLRANMLCSNEDKDFLRLSVREKATAILPAWLQFNPIVTLAGSYDTPGWAYGVAVSGNLALVADWLSGLQLIDISTPSAPTLVGTYNTPDRSIDVAISGNLVLVADDTSGLQIIDISTPSAPTLVGSYNTPEYAYGVAVSGNLALVADWLSGLQLIDISTPSAPTLVGTYDTPGAAQGVAVSGNLVLVADGLSGLQIIDISTPSAPTLTGNYNTPGNAYGVAVSGNLALVADLDSGLQLIDISTPSAPTLVGTYDTPGYAEGVAVSCTLALVADKLSGLQIIDISTPSAPALVGTYDTSDTALGVAISGNLVLVADWDSGLQIIDVNGWKLSGIPAVTDARNYLLEVTATDKWGVTVADTFSLRVDGPPVLVTPISAKLVRTGFGFDLFSSNYFIDPNGDVITYSATLSGGSPLPGWLQFSSASGVFTGTPQIANAGKFNVTLTATDLLFPEVATWFLLDADNFPTVAAPIPTQATNIGMPFNFAMPAGIFSDVDSGDIITYVATQANDFPLPIWLSFNPITRVFSGTSQESDKTDLQLKVTANDGRGGTASTTFTLFVGTEPNAVPVVASSISNQVAKVGNAFRFVVPSETFMDEDNDKLSYSVRTVGGSSWPAWLHFDEKTHTFSGTPSRADTNPLNTLSVKQIPLEVVVSDGKAKANTDFLITVEGSSWYEVGIQAASITASVITAYLRRSLLLNRLRDNCVKKERQEAKVGQPYEFKIPGNSTVYAVRLQSPRRQATCSFGGRFFCGRWPYMDLQNGKALPDWLKYNAKTRILSGTPTADDEGNFVLEVVGNANIIKHMFTLHVEQPAPQSLAATAFAAATALVNVAGGAGAASADKIGSSPLSSSTEMLTAVSTGDSSHEGALSSAPAAFFAKPKPKAAAMQEMGAAETDKKDEVLPKKIELTV